MASPPRRHASKSPGREQQRRQRDGRGNQHRRSAPPRRRWPAKFRDTGRSRSARIDVAPQALQIRAQVRGVLIAKRAVLLQRPVDDCRRAAPARRDSPAPEPPVRGSGSRRESCQTSSRQTPGAPSPSRRARCQARRCPSERRGPRLAPAPATCTPRCRRWCPGSSDVQRRARRRVGAGPPHGPRLASPKSSNLAAPRSFTKMLAGLMSRCTIPSWCAAASASAISMPNSRSLIDGQRPCPRCAGRAALPPGTP